MDIEKIVPDTSVIIDGRLSKMIDQGKLNKKKIIIPEAVVNELENQANTGREVGDTGLDEIKKIRLKADSHDIALEFKGDLPSKDEIKLADRGRIDAIIRKLAEEEDATLYTSDRVQAKVADAKGIKFKFFRKEFKEVEFELKEYFDSETMSVHIKQGMKPKAKKGVPGNLKYVDIGKHKMADSYVEKLAEEAFEKAKTSEDGLVEMDKVGATVLQIDDYRIAITRPPFSEKLEITAVRPLAHLTIDDYDLTEKFRERLEERAEGILVAGAPGHGKSTFAEALAKLYSSKGKVVKTMEHPRDLQVGPEITQYKALEDKMENTGDLLLLVRPDYTVFDEVRKTEDFEVFSDMRLAGVGMIGVVHASRALDAVQRLIGRLELGVIPQVVDTVVFIQNAVVAKVYSLELSVKVPTGMQEADLARPVVEVSDFETGEVEYEIYTYGEETVVIPVNKAGKNSKTMELAKEQLEYQLSKYIKDPEIEIESENRAKVYVDEEKIPEVIGKKGRNIERIEGEVGINLTVEPKKNTLQGKTNYSISEVGNHVIIEVGEKHSGKQSDIFSGENHLLTATVGKNGQIRITKKSEVASRILGAHSNDSLNVYL